MSLETELEKMVNKNILDAVIRVLHESELELLDEVNSLGEAGYSEAEIENMIGKDAFEIYKNSINKAQTRYNELINDEDRANGKINKI